MKVAKLFSWIYSALAANLLVSVYFTARVFTETDFTSNAKKIVLNKNDYVGMPVVWLKNPCITALIDSNTQFFSQTTTGIPI